MHERRRAKRIFQPVRAEIRLPDDLTQMSAVTSDISSCGAHFRLTAGSPPEPDARVTIKLFFGRDEAYVKTVGKVIRTQSDGFSVNFTSFALLPLQGPAVAAPL